MQKVIFSLLIASVYSNNYCQVLKDNYDNKDCCETGPSHPSPREDVVLDDKYKNTDGRDSWYAMADFEYMAKFFHKNTQTYEMGHKIYNGMPTFLTRHYFPQVIAAAGWNGAIHEERVMTEFGIGTQLDGFGHFSNLLNETGPSYWNGITDFVEHKTVPNPRYGEEGLAGDDMYNIIGPSVNISYMTRLGVDRVPPSVSRCILLNMVPHMKAKNATSVTSTSYGDYIRPPTEIGVAAMITKEDIQAVLATHKLQVMKGDTFIYHTGYADIWGTEHYAEDFVHNQPGINLEAAEWLADQGIINLGSDTTATGVFNINDYMATGDLFGPPVNSQGLLTIHSRMMGYHGVHLLELVDTKSAVHDGHSEGLLVIGVPQEQLPQAKVNPIFIA